MEYWHGEVVIFIVLGCFGGLVIRIRLLRCSPLRMDDIFGLMNSHFDRENVEILLPDRIRHVLGQELSGLVMSEGRGELD